jgi:anthranilate synthase/phosphoribosyltransferase
MLALIDNYDSFTYNLVQIFGELGADVCVFRNDQVSLEELAALHPDQLVVSPGPGDPIRDGGVSAEAIRYFTGKIPVLGVCLGHQCLGAIYGGLVSRADRLMHGKTSMVKHNGQEIFLGIPSPFEAMRYHSLVVNGPAPSELEVIATTDEGEIMALKHRRHPSFGVQFHPESILTQHGKHLLKNFLELKLDQPKGDANMLKPHISKAINRMNLTSTEAEEAMNIIMTGQATPAQIGAYLVALRMKGETIDEITGSVRAMRANAVNIKPKANGETIYDVVGTGGDGKYTFNISTAAAFVVAGTGRKVAKHGNRAASSHCGSADVLSALGVDLDLTPEQVSQAIESVGIGFMFAPVFHPAMKYAIGPRKEIGQRTIFNLLGPLTNPAGASVLLIGVYTPELTEPLANVLKDLGSQAAMVIHGAGGVDELTPAGPNRISHLKDGTVRTYEFDPQELGMPRATVEDLRGGTPEESAIMMRELLSGKRNGARRRAILLNAAGALAAETGDFKTALAEAGASLDDGRAYAKMNELVEFSHSFA